MKLAIKILLIAVFLFQITACNDEDEPIGIWDDNIDLKENHAEIAPKGGEVVIRTGETGWWINNISVNEKEYYGFNDINFSSGNYKIDRDCFSIECKNGNTLIIKLTENFTKENRNLEIVLQNGNYFDHLHINQEAIAFSKDWLVDLTESLIDCTCERSLIKGTYKEQTVYFIALTDPLCDGIDAPTLFSENGKELISFTEDNYQTFYNEVSRDEVLYRCKNKTSNKN